MTVQLHFLKNTNPSTYCDFDVLPRLGEYIALPGETFRVEKIMHSPTYGYGEPKRIKLYLSLAPDDLP